MTLSADVLDQLLEGCESAEDLFGPQGLLKQLSKRLIERMLEAELTDHLGYEKHAVSGWGSGNSRNSSSHKVLKTELGPVPLAIPRDRAGSFEPLLVPKGQMRLPSLNKKIISLYAQGLSTRAIEGQVQELYGVTISPTLASTVTASVLEEVKAW